jgi:hypothetical protein
MVQASRLDGWVERLDRSAVTTTDSSLRRSGMVLPPTLHVLSGRGGPPYVGSLVCRAFQPGRDAAVAVAAMGVLAAALGADRVVVCWENTDLSVALEVPGAYALLLGLVVLDADRTDHEVRFHPLRLADVLNEGSAFPVVVPEWEPVIHEVGGVLPEPVWRLLRVWRTQQPSNAERTRVLASLDAAGYRMFWSRQNPAGAARR